MVGWRDTKKNWPNSDRYFSSSLLKKWQTAYNGYLYAPAINFHMFRLSHDICNCITLKYWQQSHFPLYFRLKKQSQRNLNSLSIYFHIWSLTLIWSGLKRHFQRYCNTNSSLIIFNKYSQHIRLAWTRVSCKVNKNLNKFYNYVIYW